MVLIQNYGLAIVFCILAMTCWGSWANTQKMAAKTWRFELYYWDLVIGIALMGLLAAFTLGSLGNHGRTFMDDLAVADCRSILFAITGGVLWNLGNILLVAAIAVAGMAIAFPIGGGIAWILGIVINYILVSLSGKIPSDKPIMLWTGVLIIISAIVLSGIIYQRIAKIQKKPSVKGMVLSVMAGLFIAFFYGFVVKSLDPAFVAGGAGTLTPYSGIVFFSVGIIISTLVVNPILMSKPIEGPPVSMVMYRQGTIKEHTAGIIGGFIWMLGMVVSFMAVSAANPAIAYALSNAAPVVAILWGLLVWKEFRDADTKTNRFLGLVLIFYVAGLILITFSNS